ncbi:L-histidine N(alpha)-methyltransferase [Pedobacter gandavensis]|uniref:L-histidine N(Alpha)-methyltransferase n=1 Tax=Pedobacter gandavensis TaxID=2679963 RepID=A0ABR6ET77_9SPHI|nr:L-histidine N(alpha)-methyltransferase [Pedobacter gandavensis]MBB2147613.1 L-histidine N(alpha)-methyltransferase [Pedobacter gandavensis]
MDTIKTEERVTVLAQFRKDILAGLQAEPKFMQAKYFYDQAGDLLFQQIMKMDEYYLTNAEMEIFVKQSGDIANLIARESSSFDLIELGAGDATKSIHLLTELCNRDLEFSYFPIDISAQMVAHLEDFLPRQLPGLSIKGLNGDYFEMLDKGIALSNRRKVVLFMGGNIGNMDVEEAKEFCRKLNNSLSKGDLLIIGFDLKKEPKQILAAYNDAKGITAAFNLNLLSRINRELDGDFELQNFEHYACYDPESGACKSYLISLKAQAVHIAGETIHFAPFEAIYMEISQKYSLQEIEAIAVATGFHGKHRFFDAQKYFVDAVWLVD